MKNVRKVLLSGVCAASVALSASAAQSADMFETGGFAPDFYVSIFGGVALPEDVKGSATNTTGTSFRVNLDTDTGFLVGGAIGVEINEWLRTELEVSYQQVDADSFSGSNATTAFAYSARGDLDAIYILANVWADIPIELGVTPYIGGGVGVGIVDADVRVGPAPPFGPDDSDAGFAFQVGAGLKYAFNERLSFDLGYRFRGITDLDFDDRAGLLARNRGFDLYSHIIQGGITYSLGGM